MIFYSFQPQSKAKLDKFVDTYYEVQVPVLDYYQNHIIKKFSASREARSQNQHTFIYSLIQQIYTQCKLVSGTRDLEMNKKTQPFTSCSSQSSEKGRFIASYFIVQELKAQQLRKFYSTCNSPSIILSSWMRSSLDNSKDFLFFRSLSPDGVDFSYP